MTDLKEAVKRIWEDIKRENSKSRNPSRYPQKHSINKQRRF